MIAILCGFAVSAVLFALVVALARAMARVEDLDELYRIACDEAKHWHEKYDALVKLTAEERVKGQTITTLKAKADYYAERERDSRKLALHELDRSAGHG